MRRFWAIFSILVVAACTSTPPTPTSTPSPGASGALPSSGPSNGPTTGPTASPGSGPTPVPTSVGPGPFEVPPGVQFGPSQAVPESSSWTGVPLIAPDGTVLIMGRRDGPVRGQVPSTIARALVGSFDAGWQDSDMGGNDYDSQPGFPKARGGGAVPQAVALGDNGYVAVGRAIFADNNYFSFSAVGAIWRSPDGADWQLIDPRGLLGPSKLSSLEVVTALPGGGYLAAGQLAESNAKPSRIVVLGSPDGVAWQVVSEIAGAWSLDPSQIVVNGSDILIVGVEYACTDNSSHITNFAFAPVLRVWRSTDEGATWEQVDALASQVVTVPEPMPESAADCPESSIEANDRFRSSGGFVGVADGSVYMMSADGGRLAASTDLANWTQYTLPGAVTDGAQGVASRLVTSNSLGTFFMSLESWRNPDTDEPMDGGLQTVVWRLPEGGGEAERQPAGRPMVTGGTLLAGLGDDVWLWEGAAIRRSVAGPPEAWGSCVPAAMADCSFAITQITAPGADLHGIDLRAARISGGDLSGANLAGAFLGEATIYASLENADLSGARALNVSIYASLAGADLSGADLTGARVDVTFFDATRDATTLAEGLVVWIEEGQTLEGRDFSGENLSGFSFHGEFGLAQPSSMRDVDFSGADLGSASFSFVDLTGADFGGATLESVYFGSEVICPDGDSPKAGTIGKESCRL